MAQEDVMVTKLVRREFTRRHMDSSLLDVRVAHGVVYLRGVIKPVRGGAPDIRHETEIVCRALRQKPEIRDIVIDVIFRG